MFTFSINKKNITSLYKSLSDVINVGEEKEYSIIYGNCDEANEGNNNLFNDVLEWDDKDFKDYDLELNKLIELLFEKYQKDDIISFDFITNLLINEENKIEEEGCNFLFCNNCPCTGCKIDKSFFKYATNVEFIPPINYCRRSFIEYKNAINLFEKMELDIKFEDITCKDYIDLIFKAYGNSLGIEVDKFVL